MLQFLGVHLSLLFSRFLTFNLVKTDYEHHINEKAVRKHCASSNEFEYWIEPNSYIWCPLVLLVIYMSSMRENALFFLKSIQDHHIIPVIRLSRLISWHTSYIQRGLTNYYSAYGCGSCEFLGYAYPFINWHLKGRWVIVCHIIKNFHVLLKLIYYSKVHFWYRNTIYHYPKLEVQTCFLFKFSYDDKKIPIWWRQFGLLGIYCQPPRVYVVKY